jgi:hypothetical protein
MTFVANKAREPLFTLQLLPSRKLAMRKTTCHGFHIDAFNRVFHVSSDANLV